MTEYINIVLAKLTDDEQRQVKVFAVKLHYLEEQINKNLLDRAEFSKKLHAKYKTNNAKNDCWVNEKDGCLYTRKVKP